jgi:Family of unknown function (DUF6624)
VAMRAFALLLPLVALATWPSSLSAQEQPGGPAQPFLGCWRDEIDGELLRCEPTRVSWLTHPRRGDDLAFYRVRYTRDALLIERGGREERVRVSWDEGGGLVALTSWGPRRFTRIEGGDVPPELLPPQPSALGSSGPLPPDRLNALCEELERRCELDQAVRRDPARRGEMLSIDADNTAWLKEVIAEIGWIDALRFGAVTSGQAFLLVQHSADLALMQAALPRIEVDTRADRIDGQGYALLFDRLRLSLGHRQRYGTQIGQTRDGELVLMPLEDRVQVDELRAELGLFPLSDYLQLFCDENGGREPRLLE